MELFKRGQESQWHTVRALTFLKLLLSMMECGHHMGG